MGGSPGLNLNDPLVFMVTAFWAECMAPFFPYTTPQALHISSTAVLSVHILGPSMRPWIHGSPTQPLSGPSGPLISHLPPCPGPQAPQSLTQPLLGLPDPSHSALLWAARPFRLFWTPLGYQTRWSIIQPLSGVSGPFVIPCLASSLGLWTHPASLLPRTILGLWTH